MKNKNYHYNVANNEEYGSWKTVLAKPRAKKLKTMNIISRGSKQMRLDSKIKGAVRRKWIYVGRIYGSDVAAEDIKEFLVGINIGDRLEVKKLNTKAVNSSFSVGVSGDRYDQIIKGDYCPEGTIMRKLNFKNFFLSKN